MPIHEYAPLEGPGCALCCYGFERMQALHEPALTACPACGGPLRRVIGAPAVIEGSSHVLRESNVAKHGFSQYRRVAKGRYQKTTGDGPDKIGGE